jgi:hypothetical protein
VICELLPGDSEDGMLADPQTRRQCNAIDLLARKPRD